jgi:hypothetical protein
MPPAPYFLERRTLRTRVGKELLIGGSYKYHNNINYINKLLCCWNWLVKRTRYKTTRASIIARGATPRSPITNQTVLIRASGRTPLRRKAWGATLPKF